MNVFSKFWQALQPVRESVPVSNRAGGAVHVARQYGAPSVGEAITAMVRRVLRSRQTLNPLRGLTMGKVVTYLEAGERCEYADLMWLYRFIEKRDATLRGGKRSLLSAISEKDWEVKPLAKLPKGATAEMAARQVETLQAAYERIENLTEALEWLASAEFRGFAHLEKVVQVDGADDGAITRLQPVPQWHWGRDDALAGWRYDPEARSGRNIGDLIDPARFIIREIDDPIDEIALIAFVRKNLSRKDWDGFIESFGIPSVFITLPQNVGEGERADYLEQAEKVTADSRGVLPYGSEAKAFDAGGRGGAPFKEHLAELDAEIVMAITSGMLTMLAESGTGTLGGGAHQKTFDRVARALCRRVNQTMQQQFDKGLLAEAHPDEPVLAYFELDVEEAEDAGEFIDRAVKMKSAGWEVDPADVEAKTGMKVTKVEDPATDAQGKIDPKSTPKPNAQGARQRPGTSPEPSREVKNRLQAISGGLQGHPNSGATAQKIRTAHDAALRPSGAELVELLDLPDQEALIGAARRLQAAFPEIAVQVFDQGETVNAWEGAIVEALFEGLTAPRPTTTPRPALNSQESGRTQPRAPKGAAGGGRFVKVGGAGGYNAADDQAKGDLAMAELLKSKTPVIRNAMNRPGIGAVDFRWGNHKRGVAHIIARRDGQLAKFGHGPTGEEVALKMPAVIAHGTIKKGAHSIEIEHDGYRAVLGDRWNDQKVNAWVLTGFEIDPAKQGRRKGRPMNRGKVAIPPGPTRYGPTRNSSRGGSDR